MLEMHDKKGFENLGVTYLFWLQDGFPAALLTWQSLTRSLVYFTQQLKALPCWETCDYCFRQRLAAA